jgi:hypothetical protein
MPIPNTFRIRELLGQFDAELRQYDPLYGARVMTVFARLRYLSDVELLAALRPDSDALDADDRAEFALVRQHNPFGMALLDELVAK